MNKSSFKKVLAYTIPACSTEIFLFIIFYQFFAYLFIILGMLTTFVLTGVVVYTILKSIGEIEEVTYEEKKIA